MKKIHFFLILTCFTFLGTLGSYAGTYRTNLTVNIEGSGKIKLNTSSSEPSSWSTSSLSMDNSGSNFWTVGTCTYYVWFEAAENYRLDGVNTDNLAVTIKKVNNRCYSVAFEGTAIRVNKTVTVKFVADFYGRADSYADKPVGGGTYVSINGNWPNPSTDANQYKAHDESTRTATAVTSAPKYTANFAAYLNDGYKFDGWYTEENKGGTRKSENKTYSEDFTATSTSSGSPTAITRYAHFTPVTVDGRPSYTSTLNFTQPGNASTTVKFNVSNADATDDFTYSLTGELRDNTNGGWIVDSWSYSNNQVSIKLRYYCTKYTAQSSDLVNHKATITLTSKAANGTYLSADVYANVNLTPSLSVSPASKAFGEFTLANDPVQTQTFTFSFNNLNSPADNIVLVTAPTAPFSASWTESATDKKTLTVTFNPTEVNTWSQQIVVEARNSQTPYIATPCTLTVSGSAKRNNVMYTCGLDTVDGYYVEDADLNLATLWTSNNNEIAPTYEKVSFTPFGTIHEGAHEPQLTGTTLSLGQAGTLILKVSQPQTTSFNKKEETKTITINKRSNEIKTSYKWGNNNNATGWTRSLGFEDSAYVQFRSNNMESGAPHIIVRQINGNDVASFYPDSVTNDVNGDAFYTSFTAGSAAFEVSQPENYKYCAAAERQFNLNVGESDCNCILDEWSWEDELFNRPPTASGHGEVPFSGIGETLSFDARRNGSFGNQMKYQFYTNGQWSDATQITTGDGYTTYGPYMLGEGDNNTTAVKFMKGSTLGADTDDPYVNNIKVTRKRWMKLKATSDAAATISSLAKLQRKVGTAEKTATFYVDFSTCSDKVKVASNHSNVTFDDGSTKMIMSTNTTGKKGYNAIVPVTIHYSSDTIESKNVTITVYTEDKNVTLTVPVQTTGIETEIVYIGNASYPVNNADIAATSLFEVREQGTTNVVSDAAITISGSSDAASIVNNALHPLCGNKSVNLSASFAGDNRHEPSSLATPQAITIDKIADAVSFNSHPVVIIGKSYDISAWASAHTALTFESGDDDIFSIDGTTLSAHQVGTTTLKATAAGNECTYLSGAFNTESITVQPGYIFNGNNDNQWEEESNWENGEKPTIDDDVIIRGNLVIDEEVEVKSLTIENTGNVTLTVNGSLTVGSGNSIEDFPGGYGNLHVQNGGNVNLTTGKVIVNDFTLEAKLGNVLLGSGSAGVSGQVLNVDKLDVRGNAYFDLALDPSGECSPGWYDFTVPFPVDAMSGVSRFDNNTHEEKTIKNEVNYAIMDFSESRRLATGYGWKKFRSVMQPGQCYTITIDDVDNVYRFKKTANGAFNVSTTDDLKYTDTEDAARGWNCLGNGTLTYANLSAEGIEKVQVYSHNTNSYTAVPINEYTYVVGSAYMIQAKTANKQVTYSNNDVLNTLRAPRRSAAATEFTLSLTREGSSNTDDRLYVSADETATYTYEIGRELTKFGTPTDSKVAQVWANAYGQKLCDIEMPLVGDDAAECAISFYAPKAGTYTFAVDRAVEETNLYLTYNGDIIWNLSESAYTIDLTKGTTEGYGLRVNEKRAPQITTGYESVNAEGQRGNRKVMINQTIYIVTPEGDMYDLMGNSVK